MEIINTVNNCKSHVFPRFVVHSPTLCIVYEMVTNPALTNSVLYPRLVVPQSGFPFCGRTNPLYFAFFTLSKINHIWCCACYHLCHFVLTASCLTFETRAVLCECTAGVAPLSTCFESSISAQLDCIGICPRHQFLQVSLTLVYNLKRAYWENLCKCCICL